MRDAQIKRGLILLVSMIVVGCSTNMAVIIKGNQNVINKEIKIQDYDQINIEGPIEFEYSQSDGNPFLYLETDENIFDYIKIENRNGTLYVGFKNPETGLELSNYNLSPTKLVIRSGSSSLSKLSKSGSSQFVFINEIKGGDLAIFQSGSGGVVIENPIVIKSLNMNISGSGNVRAKRDMAAGKIEITKRGSGALLFNGIQSKNISINSSGSGGMEVNGVVNADYLEISHSGSGVSIFNNALDIHSVRMNLSGSGKLFLKKPLYSEQLNVSRDGSFNLTIVGSFAEGRLVSSGSGNINGVHAIFNSLDCTINGSSTVSTQVRSKLNCTITGSGKFSYRGEPEIVTISGSGNVNKLGPID